MNKTKDEIVKNEILSHAQRLFKQFGLKKTTMDEIAASCGKAKSTLYHYFQSKEEVFDSVILLELKDLRIAVKNEVDTVRGITNKITTYFIKFHQETINKVNIYRVLKQELINEALAQRYFNQIMEFERSYLKRILEDGYDSGEFIDFSKEEIPWFSEIILAAFLGIVRYSIETEEGFESDKLIKAVKLLIPRLFS